jgi:hypothetical protein
MMERARTEWLTAMRHDITFHGMLCFSVAVFFAGFLLFVTRRRDLWLRYTAAEAVFFHRLRFPPRRFTDASRRFAESRGFTYLLLFFIIALGLLAIAYAGLYVYVEHTFHGANASNQALERTADWREDLLSMTSTLNPEPVLAPVSGGSACSR